MRYKKKRYSPTEKYSYCLGFCRDFKDNYQGNGPKGSVVFDEDSFVAGRHQGWKTADKLIKKSK